MTANTVWWLMVGATIAVCVLVVFLVILALYYAYVQGYLCSKLTKPCTGGSNSNNRSPIHTSEEGMTPEQIRLAVSQNSSQLELMDSEDSSDELQVKSFSVRV